MLLDQRMSSRVLERTPAAWRRWFFGLSHLSPDVDALRTMPSALATLRYLRAVFRDAPVPDEMWGYPSPACQRRMISCISTLVTARYATAAPHFRSAPMAADWLPGWVNDPVNQGVNDLVNFPCLPGQCSCTFTITPHSGPLPVVSADRGR